MGENSQPKPESDVIFKKVSVSVSKIFDLKKSLSIGQGPPPPPLIWSKSKRTAVFLGKPSLTSKGKIKASISQVLAPLLRERKL